MPATASPASRIIKTIQSLIREQMRQGDRETGTERQGDRDRETGRQGDRDRETGDRKRFRREAHTHPLTNLSVVRSVLLARYTLR
jgi:hypothetical protein